MPHSHQHRMRSDVRVDGCLSRCRPAGPALARPSVHCPQKYLPQQLFGQQGCIAVRALQGGGDGKSAQFLVQALRHGPAIIQQHAPMAGRRLPTKAKRSDSSPGSSGGKGCVIVRSTDTEEDHPTSTSNSEWGVTAEIAAIALPTLAALAADPLAGLVDTAFLGHLGAEELAGSGVSLSLFGTVTKLINVPLLAVTTTAIASAFGTSKDNARAEPVGRAVSSVLALSAAVGVAEVVFLTSASDGSLSLWGLSDGTHVFEAAKDYLAVRAWGAPATALLLVSQGVFRGLGDTVTPLRATLLANILNLILDPLLIFELGLGVKGAAYATVAGEGIAAAFLIVQIAERCSLKFPSTASLNDELLELVKPTGFLMLRTVALSGTFAYATSVTARIGVEPSATHQLCFQIWLASSLLADALAVAAQSLLARNIAADSQEQSQLVVKRSLQLGLGLGLGLGAVLAATSRSLLGLFTDDQNIVAVAGDLFPAVILTQPLNALAFVWDGILYGVGGFRYAALAMPVCVAPSVATLWWAASASDASDESRLVMVWVALAALMGMRSLAIWVPYVSGIGPFAAIKEMADPDRQRL